MEAQAAAARNMQAQLISPAPGAARMQNVDHTPLDAIEYTPLDNPPLEELHQKLSGDDGASRKHHINGMQKALAYANGRIRKILKLTEEALECNAKLFGRLGKPADFKYKKRMDKIERQLDRDYKDISVLVRMFSARELLRMPPSDRDWTDEEIEQAGITYYTAYKNNAKQVLELIETAQQRLEAALTEESDDPDMDRLITQWKQDDVPGRAIVWRQRHPETAARLPPDQLQKLDTLAEEFHAQLHEEDTVHRRQLAKSFNLSGVRARLQILFKRHDIEELERLETQLHQYESEESTELQLLAQGYLAELKDEMENAFGIYGQLISLGEENPPEDGIPSPRLEDALRHMASIALETGQPDQALLILQTLTGLSPTYAPQFAELLRITGHWEEAVKIYSEYLSAAPEDLSIMLRLGKLYHEHGAEESARAAFEYILEQEPSNKDVKMLLKQLGTVDYA